ncbi:MAG: hypothetical protein AABW48_04095 [Nanoarchaeota archaeon]
MKTQTSRKLKTTHDKPMRPLNKHVLPAILSFFFPALGQFVKGQVKWGLTIWLWFILGNLLITVLFNGAPQGVFILLLFALNFFLWAYQISDAYNAPETK